MKPDIPHSDALLLSALAAGDVNAFNVLYERWHRRLYGFALWLSKDRHQAEELVQAVFVSVWENHEKIDPSQSFEAYLFSIARNRFTDMLRKRIVEKRYISEMLEGAEEPLYNMEEQIEADEMADTINHLIDKLPKRRREIFKLHREQHLSYKAIAKQLNITENTVDTQIRLALNFLRKKLHL